MADSIILEVVTSTTIVSEVDQPATIISEGLQGPPGIQGIQGPQGEQGPQGIQGTAQYYVHEQAVASAEWTITHNFNRIPEVTIIDSGNSEVEGDISFPTLNTVVIVFSAPFGGFAYIS